MATEITYRTMEGTTAIFETSYPSFKIIVRSASGFDVDTGYLEQEVVLSDISHKLKKMSIDLSDDKLNDILKWLEERN